MNALPTKTENPLLMAIEQLVTQHGAWPTLVATVALVARGTPRTTRVQWGSLSHHMRRDIGLPPEPAARPYWTLR